MAIFINPYRVQDGGGGSVSPAGKSLATKIQSGYSGVHNLITKDKLDPYRVDKIIKTRDKRSKIGEHTLQDFLHERSKVAQTGGTLYNYGGISSLYEDGIVQGSGPVKATHYKGRNALIERNRLRTKQLRNNESYNRDAVYNRRSSGQSTEQDYRKRLQGRRLDIWKQKRDVYNNYKENQKSLRHKQRLDFVGPSPQHPGKKPSNKFNNRTRATRDNWNQTLSDARKNKGTAYTKAASKANYSQMAQSRYDNPRTAAGKLRENKAELAREYTDTTQLRGNRARLTSAFEASRARREEIASGTRKALGPNGLGRGALFTSNKGYTQATKDTLSNLKGMQFTEVNYQEPDYLKKTWEKIKEKAKPIISGKLDTAHDKMTARFNNMDETGSGVRGFGGKNLIDGISNLDPSSLESPGGKWEEVKAKFSGFLNDDWENRKYGTPELDRFKKVMRNEASKSVRNFGDNVDPFHKSFGNDRVNRMRSAQDTIRARTNGDIKGYYDKQRAKINQQRSEFFEKVQNLPNPQQPDSSTVVSNRGTQHQFFKQGHQQLDDWKDFDKKLNQINRKQAQAERIMGWENPYKFENGKTFVPSEGYSGYGLGASNFMKASRAELGVRGLGFAVGMGGREALLNSFGVMTANQKTIIKSHGQRGLISKIMTPGMQATGFAYGSLMYTAMTGGDVSEFATNQLSAAVGLQGWRIGSSFGGMLGKERLVQGGVKTSGSVLNGIKTGVKSGLTRGALGLAGGLTGFTIGMAAVQSASWAVSDLSSNRSTIRKIAKEFSTRTGKIDTGYSKQSLTAKQMALSKLAKSGLNDRAMLLGNEARTMKGLM